MSTGNDKGPAAPTPPAAIDWRRVARKTCLEVDWTKAAQAALGSALLAGIVGGAVYVLGKALEADMHADAEDAAASEPQATDDDGDEESAPDEASAPDGVPDGDDDDNHEAPVIDERAAHAAALLGVDADASEDEIRAALRALLSGSRLHPDHGGDGEEAKRLIAAKNLLIERARTVRP